MSYGVAGVGSNAPYPVAGAALGPCGPGFGGDSQT